MEKMGSFIVKVKKEDKIKREKKMLDVNPLADESKK